MTRKPLCSTPTQRMKDKGNSCKYFTFFCNKIILIETTSSHYDFMSPPSESSIDTGAELSEIDARLLALQEYMRDLDTGH